MRYWIYVNNEVQGPFEARELSARPGLSGSSLVCPEAAGGGQAAEWKEASDYPELFAAPAVPAEDMLALTMRGSLVSEPVFDDTARPAAPPAQGTTKVGDLVFSPPAKPSPAPSAPSASSVPPGTISVPAIPPAAAADPRLNALRKKLDQMNSTLAAMGESQVQLTGRIGMLESAIADMKSLLGQENP